MCAPVTAIHDVGYPSTWEDDETGDRHNIRLIYVVAINCASRCGHFVTLPDNGISHRDGGMRAFISLHRELHISIAFGALSSRRYVNSGNFPRTRHLECAHVMGVYSSYSRENKWPNQPTPRTYCCVHLVSISLECCASPLLSICQWCETHTTHSNLSSNRGCNTHVWVPLLKRSHLTWSANTPARLLSVVATDVCSGPMTRSNLASDFLPSASLLSNSPCATSSGSR